MPAFISLEQEPICHHLCLLTVATRYRWEDAKPSNLISALTPEALQAELSRSSQLVVVDFFAPWCSACRRLFPKLLQLAENNPDVLFVKVEIPLPNVFPLCFYCEQVSA